MNIFDLTGRVAVITGGIGGGGRQAFIGRTEEQWRSMFATNLDGVFHAFQAAARHMTERAEAGDPFGRLIATSRLASLFGAARNEHYAATKAAINALVRARRRRARRLRRGIGDIDLRIVPCLLRSIERLISILLARGCAVATPRAPLSPP